MKPSRWCSTNLQNICLHSPFQIPLKYFLVNVTYTYLIQCSWSWRDCVNINCSLYSIYCSFVRNVSWKWFLRFVETFFIWITWSWTWIRLWGWDLRGFSFWRAFILLYSFLYNFNLVKFLFSYRTSLDAFCDVSVHNFLFWLTFNGNVATVTWLRRINTLWSLKGNCFVIAAKFIIISI